MYSVHNTLDTIAVIVWDSGFNNNFYKFSNLDNQDYQIGEGRTTPQIPCPPLSIYLLLANLLYMNRNSYLWPSGSSIQRISIARPYSKSLFNHEEHEVHEGI